MSPAIQSAVPDRISASEYRRLMGLPAAPLPEGRPVPSVGRSPAAQIRMPKRRKMNAGEAEFMALLRHENPGCVVMFEPFALLLPSGCRYTPDCVVMRGAEIALVCEVKGPRVHNGHSIRAFKEAVAAFPMWKFVFAQKREGGWVRKENTIE